MTASSPHPLTGTSYTNIGLSPSTAYTYTVTALRERQSLSNSSPIRATTFADILLPSFHQNPCIRLPRRGRSSSDRSCPKGRPHLKWHHRFAGNHPHCRTSISVTNRSPARTVASTGYGTLGLRPVLNSWEPPLKHLHHHYYHHHNNLYSSATPPSSSSELSTDIAILAILQAFGADAVVIARVRGVGDKNQLAL